MVGDDCALSEEINNRNCFRKAVGTVQKQKRRADFTVHLRVVKKIYTNKIKKRVDFIEKTVFEKSGYKIKIEKPTLKMGLLPSVWVGASNFAVLNDDNSKALDVENPNINVKLLPLILKNLDKFD